MAIRLSNYLGARPDKVLSTAAMSASGKSGLSPFFLWMTGSGRVLTSKLCRAGREIYWKSRGFPNRVGIVSSSAQIPDLRLGSGIILVIRSSVSRSSRAISASEIAGGARNRRIMSGKSHDLLLAILLRKLARLSPTARRQAPGCQAGAHRTAARMPRRSASAHRRQFARRFAARAGHYSGKPMVWDSRPRRSCGSLSRQ